VLYIKAKTVSHIQAGINFARDNNLRLIIRNTGHDFLGRSVGWGSLVINTHGFQDIKFSKSFRAACDYTGSAVTVGAGVQAFQVLKQANALNPPKIMVTGECAVLMHLTPPYQP
jgi:FAD/FMN-containing dehydrogenase